jgi:hypothetical protein
MTSPASVWVARFELAISRFQAERSRQIEPHPDFVAAEGVEPSHAGL